jgi:YHS domain-containing protein
MNVDEQKPVAKTQHRGMWYYCCSTGRQKVVAAEPVQYARPQGAGPQHGGNRRHGR